MKRYILIDFENIQKIDLDLIDTTDTEVVIFVGRSQNKIPFSLVEKAQSMGSKIQWLKIAGDGKNNLDFHIAYVMGKLSERGGQGTEMVILSRDAGYDPLIQYIKSSGIKARRIASVAELTENKKQLPSSSYTQNIVNNLTKIAAQKRPRSRGTLRKHIESHLRDKTSPEEIDLVLEEMFIKGYITQSNNRLSYHFPEN